MTWNYIVGPMVVHEIPQSYGWICCFYLPKYHMLLLERETRIELWFSCSSICYSNTTFFTIYQIKTDLTFWFI